MRVASQTIFLDSSQGEGAPWAWRVHFEPSSVACAPGQRLVLKLTAFHVLASWSWIPRGAVCTYKDDHGTAVPLVLPEGNPKLRALAADLQAQVRASAPSRRHVSVDYLPASGKLLFTSGAGSQLTFPDDETAALLGFRSRATRADGQLRSDEPIKPVAFDSIRIGLAGVTRAGGAHSCTNSGSRFVRPCDTLAIVPVDAEPFTWLTHTSADDSFAISLADWELRSLEFTLSDFSGRPLTALPHHYITLSVETHSAVGG